MAFRPRIEQAQVITNGNMTGTLTSRVTVFGQSTIGSYQFNWSGTSPVGAIQILVSNDYSIEATGAVNNAGNWVPMYFLVNGGTSPVNSVSVSGNTGSAYVAFADKPYAIKAVYTPASGTGTLNAFLNAGGT